MTVKNQDIRNAAKKADIKLWQIAEKLGIWDSTFSKKLRKELPQEEKEKICGIISELAKENQEK